MKIKTLVALALLCISGPATATLMDYNFSGEFDEAGGCTSDPICGPYDGVLTIDDSQSGIPYGDAYLYIIDSITVTLADSNVLEDTGVSLRAGSTPGQQEIATFGSLFDPIYLFWRTPLNTFQSDDLSDILTTLQAGPFISSHIRIWESDITNPACNGHCVGTLSAISPVPIPPALWLFGSGLLGLVGMARSKKAA